MSTIKVNTTRYSYKTTRYTSKNLVHGAVDMQANRYNTDNVINFEAVTLKNKELHTTVQIELTERTLLKALTKISHRFTVRIAPTDNHCTELIKNNVGRLELLIDSIEVADFHAMMEIIKTVSNDDFNEYVEELKKLPFDRYCSTFICKWARLYS